MAEGDNEVRVLSFKEKYIFKLPDNTKIEINPIERIKLGLKQTTFRLNELKLEDYRLRQGSYFKKNFVKDFYLKVTKVIPKNIMDLTEAEIQTDLGLTNEELANIKYYTFNLQELFLTELAKINKDKLKKENPNWLQNPVGYLIYFVKMEYDFYEFKCKSCRNTFTINKVEIDWTRTDLCTICIEKLAKEIIAEQKDNIKQIVSQREESIAQKRLLNGI